MDSITHIALGACMGEAFLDRKLGRKALLWGAVAQSAPDIDFLASFWMNTSSNLLAHRGFTHSFLFVVLISVFLALLAERWHRPHNISFRQWLLFFAGVIFIHVFIDAFNNYGVGWFEPFSHKRISFNAIYVADPFFSIWPGIALLMLIFIKHSSVNQRKKWWTMGLVMSGIYLLYCLFNKQTIDRDVKKILKTQDIRYTRYFTTPTALQNWLWYVVAGNDSGYYIGYRSVFDGKKQIDFEYFPRNDHLLDSVEDTEALQKLKRFSREFYTAEEWSDTLVFNDLRFGQITGWQDPRNKFVFHYYLKDSADNKLVVQRGRLEGWNIKSFKSLIKRIEGN
jgi:inner membrane protein